MLEMLCKQGIDRVLCTPHYYGERESAEDFLSRREQSLAQISQEAEQMGVRLAAGAEIAMWHGMSAEIIKDYSGLDRIAILKN